MNERVAYLNGGIVPESKATISIRDRGFLLGDAVFDTTRTFGHQIFRLEEHLDRLFRSLKYMRIDPGMTKDDLANLTMQVKYWIRGQPDHALEANLGDDDDYWVTQRFTRGSGISMEDPSTFKPTVIIECLPLPLRERARLYRDGLAIVTPSIRRTPPEAMSPRAKMNNYINLVLADLEVKGQNPDAMAITLDINGNLCEGMGSNIFVVRDGAISTPREQYVLAGISREVTMELAQKEGIRAYEKDIDLFDAYTADEVFVTSTSFCVCPVSTVNGSRIGTGKVPGPITRQLQQAYSNLVGIDIVQQYLRRLQSS